MATSSSLAGAASSSEARTTLSETPGYTAGTGSQCHCWILRTSSSPAFRPSTATVPRRDGVMA